MPLWQVAADADFRRSARSRIDRSAASDGDFDQGQVRVSPGRRCGTTHPPNSRPRSAVCPAIAPVWTCRRQFRDEPRADWISVPMVAQSEPGLRELRAIPAVSVPKAVEARGISSRRVRPCAGVHPGLRSHATLRAHSPHGFRVQSRSGEKTVLRRYIDSGGARRRGAVFSAKALCRVRDRRTKATAPLNEPPCASVLETRQRFRHALDSRGRPDAVWCAQNDARFDLFRGERMATTETLRSSTPGVARQPCCE